MLWIIACWYKIIHHNTRPKQILKDYKLIVTDSLIIFFLVILTTNSTQYRFRNK